MRETSGKSHLPNVGPVLIEARAGTDPELVALVTAQQRELSETGAGPDAPGLVVRPAASYLVGVVDGWAVACGAIRLLDRGVAEITGVYVRPAYRNRGLGRQLIAALEELAFRAGRPVLRLETCRSDVSPTRTGHET
jgi:putative acetyltransferase